MTEKLIDEMRVPHGEEYSTAVDTNIRRHTICELNDNEIQWLAVLCRLRFKTVFCAWYNHRA